VKILTGFFEVTALLQVAGEEHRAAAMPLRKPAEVKKSVHPEPNSYPESCCRINAGLIGKVAFSIFTEVGANVIFKKLVP